ncbi:MAG: heparinase II/III family protein [Sediminibacterium sp.]
MQKNFSYKFLLLTCILLCNQLYAHDYRNLLQKKASLENVKKNLVSNKQWIKYPNYTDRAGWDKYTNSFKAELIQLGEKQLNYEWKVVKATDYLEFETSGSRVAMEKPFTSNLTALSSLVMAELSEGKGRFLPQIINGVWQTCEMSSWALSAHLVTQKSKSSLPDFNEQLIDLTVGDLGSFLSWTYYFFNKEFDKFNPIISKKLRKNLQDRILDPYMERSDYWWQAFNAQPSTMVNNWNPWCNFNMLTCYLLLEENPIKQAKAVYRTMESVDKFINYNHEDGGCEEGPSYWGHAAGKMYDYLQLLSNATNGKVSIFNEPIIKNMGEYIAKSYVGNGWVVNFADASAKGGGEAGAIYRYGIAVKSTDMQSFAAYLISRDKNGDDINAGRDIFRTLENIANHNSLIQTKAALPQNTYAWYPQTQFCYMKTSNGLFFAAKAGYNAESHNHNDVGTFSLYLDAMPLIIDVGVGTYTRQTFSNERYSIWSMQSNYHNLPMINGLPQQFGAEYKAKNVVFDSLKHIFSLDMAGAYSKDVLVDTWNRKYELVSDNGLIITDQFELKDLKDANQINFMTWGKPNLSTDGSVIIEKESKAIVLKYNPTDFIASYDVIPQTDPRLSNVWGKELYRLKLVAKKISKTGTYTYQITPKK